jgi:hypothetical protein
MPRVGGSWKLSGVRRIQRLIPRVSTFLHPSPHLRAVGAFLPARDHEGGAKRERHPLPRGATEPAHPGDAVTVPVCVCCGWSMGTLDVATPGRDGLCLVCEIAGCTATVIGPHVERPEVHRRPLQSRPGS